MINMFTHLKNTIKEAVVRIWHVPILFSFVWSVALVLFIESLSRHSVFGGLEFLFNNPLFFIFNTLPLTAIFTLTYFIPKRLFVQFFVSILIIAMGVVNFVLLFNRVRPFEAVDFSILATGFSLVKLYINVFELILCIFAILAAIACVVVIYVKSPISSVNIKETAFSALIASLVFAVVFLLFSVCGFFPRTFEDTNKAYDRYGFIYCFTRSIFDRGIEEPEDYSEHSVEEILEIIGSDKTKDPKKKPNVIMIQLESFMDPALLTNLEFEYNPVPNFTVLKNNCTSGVLMVPSVGSGTANTEFEVLTGMCLDYFGTGEYPYKTILQSKNCETVCYNLSELGYTSHAIHNYTGTFYNRNYVYKNLGFNTFTPLEYMHSYDVNPLGWAKDYVLENEIITSLKSTKGKDLVFAVSVQGHGKYPEKPVEGEKLISVSGIENEAIKHQMEYYAYQLWEMDDFIGRLVRTLNDFDEDCVLVLYGDHQPSIAYEEADIVYKDKHASEYVIWANFKIEEKDRNIESYQLTAYAMELVGINNGLLTKLHQNYSESDDYERALQTLEYDMLYGDMLSYGEGHEYISTDMKMGNKKISVTGVSYVGEIYYVLGENFTQNSRINVNGRDKETLYVSPTVLILNGFVPEAGDTISVRQISNDNALLGECTPFLYSGVSGADVTVPDIEED